jgi:RNA polymerase sigma-70 factor, ECF subfamily
LEEEFIELVNKHQGILHKICNVYFNKSAYKEDYYQEMLIRLWKSYPAFNNQSAFSTWLYRVAINTAIDIVRKQYLLPKHTELSNIVYNIPEHEYDEGSYNKEILYQAIDHLSDVDKAIILLYLEDYNYKEIAEIIGISESNAGVNINRIKNQLIKTLKNGNG